MSRCAGAGFRLSSPTFPGILGVFRERTPFTRRGQFEHHRETIRLRRSAVSVGELLANDAFVDSLRSTLRAWSIGVRASHLLGRPLFDVELQRWEVELESLTDERIVEATDDTRRRVWALIQSIDITENQARLVALTKTLHHILPDLVVPIDRAYTGAFLGWRAPEFQTSQRAIFDSCWEAFVEIARQAHPEEWVGEGWFTSTTKVIDNAIVGFCIAEGLVGRDEIDQPEGRPATNARRAAWMVEDLESDLEEFGEVLRAAGLRDNTINTYVGRAETFIRWLAGDYEPRGPNSS